MDWLPDLNYWAVICALLVALNIWQYAKYHGVSANLAHALTFGHAPEGKVLVPATSVSVATGPLITPVAAQADLSAASITPPANANFQSDIPPWRR